MYIQPSINVPKVAPVGKRRIKTRFANAGEVIAVWLSQSQPEGRSSNTSFDGNRLYSYAADIAVIVPDKRGKPAVLVSNRKWSRTTSGHQSSAIWAARGREMPAFDVASIGWPLRRPCRQLRQFESDISAMHQGNLAALISEYRDEIDGAKRHRARPSYQSFIAHKVETVRLYAKTFGLKIPRGFNPAADWQAIEAHYLALWIKANDPKVKARRERAQQRRDAAIIADYRTLSGKFSSAHWQSGVRWHRQKYVLSILTPADHEAREANLAAREMFRKMVDQPDATLSLAA